MGQQQLLLLVFGIVVVGIAVVAGLHAFEAKSRQLTMDNLLNRNITIATNAVAWKMRQDPWEGGNAEYTTFTFQKMGLDPSTSDGRFEITTANGQELVITGVSKKYPDVGVRTYMNGTDIDSTITSSNGDISIP